MFNPFKKHQNLEVRKQLERVETRFEKVAQTATDAILIIDQESIILFCNPVARSLFGHDEKEMIGKDIGMIMPAEFRPIHKQGLQNFISTGKSKIIGKTIELTGLRKNGVTFPLELSLSAWKEDGKYFFTGIIRDVSERYKLVKELQLLQDISREISEADDFLHALESMVKRICQEGKWELAEVWLEQDPGVITFAPVWHAADEKYITFIEESRKTRLRIGEGMPGRIYSGKVEWCRDVTAESSDFLRKELAKSVGLKAAFGIPIVSSGKIVAGLLFFLAEAKEEDVVFTSIVSSLTNQLGIFLEKKQAEENVRVSRDFYLTIFEEFPAMVWRANVSAKCDYFNKTWLEFTGRSMKEEMGDGWVENVHSEDLEQCFNVFISSFNKREFFEMEYRLRRYDGEYRWIKDFGRPLYNPEKEFIGYIGACYDITEQKENSQDLLHAYEDLKESNEELLRTEELLKELNAQLELKVEKRTKELKERNEKLLRINRDLDSFIYTASHDLRAPISNLEGLVNAARDMLIQDIPDKETLLDVLNMMHDSVTRFTRTISDLTEITKVQKLKQDDVSLQSLVAIIQGVISDLNHKICEADADISLDLGNCPSIKFSLKNLRSIIYNLLSNAIKYRSPDRKLKVYVSCEKQGNYAVLSVKDNGLGIDLQKAKLFTMFKRFHDHVEGTGIGLYIIKRIIEDAGGKIQVESEPGVGSTFLVYFPGKKK